MTRARTLATALASVAAEPVAFPSRNTPPLSPLDRAKMAARDLSLVDRLQLMAFVLNHDAFADCDFRKTDTLDATIAWLLDRAEEPADVPGPQLFPYMAKVMRERADLGVGA